MSKRRWTKSSQRVHPEGFTCAVCGDVHEGPPFDYAAPVPDLWLYAPDDVREDGVLSDDLCWMKLDGDDLYFVRGVVPVRVIDSSRTFNWGVWAVVAPPDFARVVELWDDDERATEPPFPGWLATAPAIYPDSDGLDLMVQLRGGNLRPTFELVHPDHPMAAEQRNGMTVARVQEIAELLLHSG
ncbi:MAG TPA: DUF2199 domain-containing protein [Actinomycetota bacterium]